MSAKFALICISFSLPIALLLHLFTKQMQSQIEFTERELLGTAYLRPLLELQTMLWEPNSPEYEKSAAAVWNRLDEVQELYGAALQFTEEGLGKRGRLGLEPRSMRERWTKARLELGRGVVSGTQALEADLQRMITHAGDASNLILDPDLDTYYLMDVTLLGLPEVLTHLSRTSMGQASAGLHGSLLKEMVLPRVESRARTAWIEDGNFGGTLVTLRPRLEGGFVEFSKTHKALIAALEGGESDGQKLAVLRSRARWASLTYWRVAVEELDALLGMRVEKLRMERNQAWAVSGLAVMVAGALALFLLQSITKPLALIARELGPESTAMRESAEKLSIAQIRHTLTEDESRKLAAEMNQQSILIRRVVVELLTQISGGASELVCRVEGIGRR